MADDNLLHSLNEGQVADTSMLLDTLMYTDCLIDKYNGWTVDSIISHMRENSIPNGQDANDALANLEAYRDAHPDAEIWNLRLYSASEQNKKDYTGVCGAVFYKGDELNPVNVKNPSDVYVAFRGTGDGRWYDNGDAFAKEYSNYQEAAAKYFDDTMTTMQVDSSCNLIATGHSKGGNFAQFIALASKHALLVDKVLSYDGQGFSPEAEDFFKDILGPEAYEAQRQKMYSICGDNDFVNILGNKVIPDENTIYIEVQPSGKFADNHALFTQGKDGVDTRGNLFDYNGDGFLPTTDNQKELSLIVKAISSVLMTKPQFMRSDICRTIMSLAELKLGTTGLDNRLCGLKGETIDLYTFNRAVLEVLAIAGWEGLKYQIGNLLEKFKASAPGQFLGQITNSVMLTIKEKGIPGAMAVLDGVGDWISDKYKQGKEAVQSFGSHLLEQGKEFCRGVKDTFNKARDFITGKSGNNHHSHGGGLADSPRGGHGGGGGSPSLFGNNGSLLNLFANQNSDDLIIDEDAINKAVEAFADLSKQLQDLRHDIEEMLATLKIGFDTPAGRKFIKSCENNLITPLERQRLVIEHISQNLQDVKTNYYSVFDGYRDLINKINSYQS